MSSDSIEAVAPGDADVFVARQPVMDRAGRVVGYELLFRDGPTGGARIGDELGCTTAVIERAVGSIGLEREISSILVYGGSWGAGD